MKGRLRPLGIFAALLLVALAGVGCGGSGGGNGASAGAGSESAQTLLDKAFATPVKSADVDLSAKVALNGIRNVNGPLTLEVTGPYKSNGPKALPLLDWKVTAAGAGQKLTGGVIVSNDNAYVDFQGQAYEVGAPVFAVVKHALAKGKTGPPATALKKLGLDPSRWLTDASAESGGEIGGDPVRRVTGKVNVDAVVDDIFSAARSREIRKQLESAGTPLPGVPKLSKAQLDKIKKSITDANVSIDIDRNNLVRGLGATVEFKIDGARAGKLNGGKVALSYTLPRMGVSPKIVAPANPKPLLGLLVGLGLGGLPQSTQ